MIKTIEELEDLIQNEAPEPDRVIYFSEPAYLSAILGFDHDSGAIIYDYDKMCYSLMDEDPDCYPTYEEAAGFIDYNLSYGVQGLSGIPPIVLIRPVECEEDDGME